jgi:hypothetical protein
MVKVFGVTVIIAIPLQSSVLPPSTFSGVIVAMPKALSITVSFIHTAFGGTTSVIVTLKLQLALLPLASVTVQVTTVVPTGYVPLASPVPLKLFTTVEPGQLSPYAGGSICTKALQVPGVAGCVTFGWQLIVGGWLSDIVTVWLHVAVLPLRSVAVHVTVVTPIG